MPGRQKFDLAVKFRDLTKKPGSAGDRFELPVKFRDLTKKPGSAGDRFELPTTRVVKPRDVLGDLAA
jgi:hypothetical protein